jgi:hypothetical protein
MEIIIILAVVIAGVLAIAGIGALIGWVLSKIFVG